MAYGNILTLYDADLATCNLIENIFQARNISFQKIETTFFFSAPDIADMEEFNVEIKNLPIVYTLLFIFESHNSTLSTKGVHNDAVIANLLNVDIL